MGTKLLNMYMYLYLNKNTPGSFQWTVFFIVCIPQSYHSKNIWLRWINAAAEVVVPLFCLSVNDVSGGYVYLLSAYNVITCH